MSRQIIHVDMDAFYASVEMRERPALSGKPLIVGGTPQERGVVAAASYAARRYGIHSAMPTSQALRLCPDLIILPPRHDLYAAVSRQIHAIFARYTPQIEPLALDEAFLDVTASLRLFGSGERIGRAIKAAIYDELQLVASVGVAPNKFLAKLASDHDKPDGFVVIGEGQIQAFLDPLPIETLWGVGKVTAKSMQRLGITTVGQLRHYPMRLLQQHFGNGAGHLWALAHGIDDRPVVTEHEAKSISHETTFAQDISDIYVLRAWLSELTEQVARRLRRQGLKGRTIQIKVRFADFSTITRARSLSEPTDITALIRETVQALFTTHLQPLPQPVRLIGVGISGLDDFGIQQSLAFEQEREEKQQRVDSLLDTIKERYGSDVVRRGPRTEK